MHTFCRLLLKEVMKDVRKHVSKEDIDASWAYKSSTGTFEFHGPNEFYWYGQADCKWHAKALGWEAYLRENGK